MDEKLYLIALAVSAYNEQFGYAYVPGDFDVKSIEPNNNADFGFEFLTPRYDDFLRLRLYGKFGNGTWLSPYRVDVDVIAISGPGDEVFVADAVFDYSLLYNTDNFIRRSFPNLILNLDLLDVLITDDNEILITDDGEELLF